MFAGICFADSIFNLVSRLKLRRDKTVSIKHPDDLCCIIYSEECLKVDAKEKYSLVDIIKYTRKWMTGNRTKKNPNPPQKNPKYVSF